MTREPNPKDTDKGVPIYVDPVCLQEAEKTGTSPITLDLDGVTVAKGLTLVLKQLGLTFYVDEDGLVRVVTQDGDDQITDPHAKVLDELSPIRADLARLRRELGLVRAHLQARPRRPGAGGDP